MFQRRINLHYNLKVIKGLSKKMLNPGATSEGEKTTSSTQDIKMAPLEQPLKCEDEGANEKKTYHKVFTTRMTTRSFSSLVAQLNKAQIEVVRSMTFVSFLKANLKQIPGKFLELLVDTLIPTLYASNF